MSKLYTPYEEGAMSELVQKLSIGQHRVSAFVHPEKSIDAFKRCVEDGYVHVRFPDTRGGTTLGITLDRGLTDMSGANFESNEGRVTLSGTLTLDYVPVRCEAVLTLPELEGTGRLVVEA